VAVWDALAATLRVSLATPAIAAPGQGCVLYQGDRVLGGGFIRGVARAVDSSGQAA
jgi:tRNA-specific 2-thiouridylase